METVEAAALGVIMLDTRFPRPPGDIGNPASFAVPVRQRVVSGAWPAAVVQTAEAQQANGMQPAFVAAARALQADGVRAITTSCGFLVLMQQVLQAAVKVPVVTSSLLALPGCLAREGQVGVLTISADKLGPAHLRVAGVPEERLGDVLVQGMDPEGAFAGPILRNQPGLDVAAAEADVVRAALVLQAHAPHLRTLVLECTNMPPYAAAIERRTGWRTLSLLQSATLLHVFSRTSSLARSP
ncbi:hypothetical protein RD110_05915 [Rhodoferax koreense]|uniref:Aspartate/glutamate racemase family protein n=2 Tax=Rhodoferax koreensis TaxID=1842727 RepID=A0A1P8JSN9_9BURK|nr:hypothetical protein RD110_05915 [Rhodoferax koreense]